MEAALGEHGTSRDQNTADDVELDIVFIHGMRGSAYTTWRMYNLHDIQNVQQLENYSHDDVTTVGKVLPGQAHTWPAAFLSKDVPQARVLAVEYAAPMNESDISADRLRAVPLTIREVAS